MYIDNQTQKRAVQFLDGSFLPKTDGKGNESMDSETGD